MTQMMNAPANLPATRSSGNGAVQRFNPNALASDTSTLKGMLDASREKLQAVIPRHLNPDRLMRVALVAVSRSTLLQECTVSSILQCVMTGAQLGLDCSGVLGSAYMVPFWNGKAKVREAVFMPGFRGLIDLARRSGEIEDINAHCVYKDDEFDLELGAVPLLKHKPSFESERRDEDIVGAYMVAYLKGNSRPHIEFMPRQDIEKIRRGSKAAFDRDGNPTGPWRDWFPEMCRKSVVKRGIKYLPVSVELTEAISLDNTANDTIEATQVHSASTGAGRTEKLLSKVTQRPVSEGQTFDPSPDAGGSIDVPAFDASTGEEIAGRRHEGQGIQDQGQYSARVAHAAFVAGTDPFARSQ